MAIWSAFGNSYWPADYIYDRKGHQASVHFGEGDYAHTEDVLRALLGVAKDAPHAVVKGTEGGSDGSAGITGETYNGSRAGGPSSRRRSSSWTDRARSRRRPPSSRASTRCPGGGTSRGST